MNQDDGRKLCAVLTNAEKSRLEEREDGCGGMKEGRTRNERMESLSSFFVRVNLKNEEGATP